MTKTDFPTLFKLTSTGKVQMWEIAVNRFADPETNGGTVIGRIETRYGQVDGKIQTSVEYIKEGKNLGKANETTPVEQAYLEAQSQWEKKSKKGYVQNVEDAQEKKVDETFVAGGIVPMLAHTYEKQGDKIRYPAFAQPKLDGHRCIAVIKDGKCTLWSRTQKRINSMPHIVAKLESMFPGGSGILDGELYNHDYRENFEELSSKIRQSGPAPGHEVVQYWVYDMVNENTQADRIKTLEMLQQQTTEQNIIVFVPTENVEDEEEMIAVFGAYLEAGFEGLMLRNKDAWYKHGRAYGLQKVKTFLDSEYTVVAVEEGKGKMAGKAMFVCELPDGNTFRVKMVGALDDLMHYFENPDLYIGRELTVKYQGLSAYGVPRFPVALRFRDAI